MIFFKENSPYWGCVVSVLIVGGRSIPWGLAPCGKMIFLIFQRCKKCEKKFKKDTTFKKKENEIIKNGRIF